MLASWSRKSRSHGQRRVTILAARDAFLNDRATDKDDKLAIGQRGASTQGRRANEQRWAKAIQRK